MCKILEITEVVDIENNKYWQLFAQKIATKLPKANRSW